MKKITLLAILMIAITSVLKAEPTTSLSFNGTDQYVDIPTTEDFQMTSSESLSFSFWAKTANSNINPRIFSNRYNQTKDGSFEVFNGTLGYAVMFLSTDGSDPINAYLGGATTSWVHVAVVCDRESGEVTSYVNGTVSAKGTMRSTDVISTTTNTTLGTSLNSGGALDYFLNGSIANMRFYRGALSSNQVLYDMVTNSYSALPNDLKDICTVAYDLTDELYSDVLEDKTGNGNNGTLVNYEDDFVIPERTITVISSDDTKGVVSGGGTAEGEILCSATPLSGYAFLNWTNSEGEILSTNSEFYENEAGDKTITANFVEGVIVTTSTDGNGVISPEGDISIPYGGDKTFTVTANDNYRIESLLLDDIDVTDDMDGDQYTIANITTTHTLTATFTEVCPSTGFDSPLTETFESSSVTQPCWSIIDANEDGATWGLIDDKMRYNYSSSNSANDWLVSPKINVGEGMELAFKYYVESSYYDEKFSVYAMQSPTDYENAVKILDTQTVDNSSTDIRTMRINISEYAGESVYFAIKCESDTYMYYLYIDDFKVDLATYNVEVIALGQGNISIAGADASTTQSTDIRLGEYAEILAVANTGYEFSNWTNDNGDILSTDNPLNYYATSEDALYANFVFASERTISLAINNPQLAQVWFTSPQSYLPTLTTKQEVVTITTAAVDDNSFFLNWTDANGDIYSESQDITYSNVDPISLTANYEARYIVTTDDGPGGDIIISVDGEEINSGSRVLAGTNLNIALSFSSNKIVSTLVINGEDVTSQYNNESGYNMEITATTLIEATFKDPDIIISYSATGAGYIEIWSDDDGAPAGDKYTNGGAALYNDPLYIFPYTYDGGELISLVVDGEDKTEEYNEGFADGYLSLEYYPVSNMVVEATFTGESTGIEDLAAASAKVYGISSAIVIEAQGAATIYTLTGAAVKTVVVNGSATINMPQGVYIATINGVASKVIVY